MKVAKTNGVAGANLSTLSSFAAQFAIVGARARLAEIEAERGRILEAFPALAEPEVIQRPGTVFSSSINQFAATVGKRKGGRRPGFKMSAEAKAKIAKAARKRWALKRAKAVTGGTPRG